MRIVCANCGKPANIFSRPPQQKNESAGNGFKDMLFRVYVSCQHCQWTGHSDVYTKMSAPKPSEEPLFFKNEGNAA